MTTLTLKNVVKNYQSQRVVRGINLDVADNEFVVLVGPSGCGKSTTLRMIAGLEHISGGQIIIGDRVVNKLGPGQRDIAMVFQNYALYPHMTVRENIAFCLEQQKMGRDEINRRVEAAARTLHIGDLLTRRPGQLSGGQRQRVAMGRAIVRNPKVFLFDEPLSNLDAKLRVQMRTEIKRLHQAFPTTTIYVTHDQTEAMTMADRVVVMNNGVIEQMGPPQELYHCPASMFVAGFIGSPSMNFLPASVEQAGEGLDVVLGDGTRLPVPPSRLGAYGPHKGKPLTLGIRPESIVERGARPAAPLNAHIELVEPLGLETMIYFKVGDDDVCARVANAQIKSGATMPLAIVMEQAHLFETETGKVIAA